MDILGVELPLIELPVRPGRSLAMVVEIAARNWRLKAEGYDAVAELDRRLQKALHPSGINPFPGARGSDRPGRGGGSE